MADSVDPLKNTLEGFSNVTNNGDIIQRRPSYSSVWTRQPSTDANQQLSLSGEQQQQEQAPSIDVNQQMHSYNEEQPQSASSKRSRFVSGLNRTLSRKSDSFSWSQLKHPFSRSMSSDGEPPQRHSIEHQRSENMTESYAAPEGEYYANEKPYKRKGISVSMILFIFDRYICNNLG
jgi:hypothetical protein